MSYEEDITTIQNSLTGDEKKDIRTLFEAAEEYKGRPYFHRINEWISARLEDMVRDASPEKIAELTQYIQNQSSLRYDRALKSIQNQIRNKEYESAISNSYELEKQVEKAMAEASTGKSNLSFRYCFSMMEYVLADKAFPDEKIVILPLDYVSLLTLRGEALFKLGKEEEAFASIHEAFFYDPVSVDLCFLKADLDIETHNMLSLENDLEKAHEYLFKAADYFRYYRYLLKYYENQEEGEDTAALLLLMLHRDYKSPYDFVTTLSPDIKGFLEEKQIPLTLSDFVLDTYKERLKVTKEEGNLEAYKYYADLYRPFLSEEEGKKLISEPNEEKQS